MSKGHTKRPLVVKLGTAYFLIAPVLYLATFSVFRDGSLISGWELIRAMTWESQVVLFGSWVAAALTWMVRPWSWYPLIAYCAFAVWQTSNNLRFSSVFPTWAVVTGEVLGVAGVLLFLHKEVRSPYLNPRMCWWKTSPRYRVDYDVGIQGKSGAHNVQLLDISKTGCFVTMYPGAEAGETLAIEFPHLDCKLEGAVVRTGFAGARANQIEGVGIRFEKAPPEALKKVKGFVAQLAGKVPSRDEPKSLLHLEERAKSPSKAPPAA